MTRSHRKLVTGGDMRTPVTFYIAKPNDDFFPGESTNEVFYQCFANVYPPSQKDLDMTDNKATITMITWYSMEYEITDDMYFEIDLPRYRGKKFNIIQIDDDTDFHSNIKIIGEFIS